MRAPVRSSILPLLLALSSIAAPARLLAQQPRQVTAQDYARAERFLPQNVIPLVSGSTGGFTWLADGRLWYRATVPGGYEFLIADGGRRTKAPAFDHARMATALSTAMGQSWTAQRLPPLTPSENGREATVNGGSRSWTCNLQTYTCAASRGAGGAPRAEAPDNSVTSPDGRYAAYIRSNNLWVKDLTTNQDRALTTDGVQDYGYATNNAGWIRSPEPVLLWSPDSKKIATFQHDARGASNMYLITTNVGAPKLDAWKYPLPGDSVVFKIERVIIDVEPTRVVRLRMPPDAHRSSISDHVAEGSLFLDVQWYPDASRLAFVSSSRDHKVATLRVADASTGEVRTVLEERSQTQFQSSFYSGTGNVNWRVLPASNEVLWWSQRDNWGHLYLYDLQTGALKQQITSGSWNVNRILKVDERARTLFLTGLGREAGRDPYFEHLYRIGMDGRGIALLTPEDATHSPSSLSPDGRQFVDVYSTPTMPTVTVLRRVDRPQETTELSRLDVTRLQASGWKPPTPITVKARDGMTDLYGLMWTPTTLDSTRTYPIVDYIYPGPWSNSVPTRTFQPALGDFQALAELGFVVVAIDNMGTEFRSKSFGDAYYGNMGDNGLPDQVAGMRELARRYRFIDIDRAGIWGHSGGGFAAADAMFRYPDFFKVGISESGNHDNRNYEDDWGERFQGLLRRTPQGDNYDSQANQLVAGNLKGKLLLTHGGMDDNVPPSNTYLVVDALIKANKDFDLIIFPNQAHGYGEDSDYMMRRRWDYFVKHLLGAEPPLEYRIGG
jgi:dipeptidyl aminopeptidase/acylaminoacyl peptidase